MKRIIGMIHLAGGVERALEEIKIYEENGLSGALVENYHGDVNDVEEVLSKVNCNIPIGVNILPNEFEISFRLATEYGLNFIQLDYVAGTYAGVKPFDSFRYEELRKQNSDVEILGGVWPKYYNPVSDLENDLKEGIRRADAIVVTGEGTGKETPLEKIKLFRKTIGTRPLIVGAGCTAENIASTLEIADGAIVGSYFKHGNTGDGVDEKQVKRFMRSF